MYDYVVVGAGFAGSVIAERLATAGTRVLIIDKRNHVGGNAFDHYNNDGILVHKYGPHIFHTNCQEVFDYLSQFTKWRFYEHKVLTSVDSKLVPIPINLTTVNTLYNLNLTSEELMKFYESIREDIKDIKTSEDVVVSQVGWELYEKFFKGYTKKQWGVYPSELDKSVASRIPTRTNTDDRYFTDAFQYMPLHGYTRMFENMLSHPKIHILLNTDYKEIENIIPYKNMIYTGPVDEYFEFCYGKLPYRSLKFKHETLDTVQLQPVAVVNYPNEFEYTRVTEYKHLTGQVNSKTSITYEFPSSDGDPYYPVPRKENAELYQKYKNLADTLPNVHFVGRLATYKYYNMDQVVAQSLAVFKRIMNVPKSLNVKANKALNGRKKPLIRVG
ncbi:MAG TPA: UDP-galactopyranose mutase [Cytophagales bacterium]|nr:UDP-galactopyranose mutase [Cytophagales bacterium]